MAVAFNILKIWFDEFSIIMFWVIPAFLETFQLFFFGTYLPHKYPHTKNMQLYKARTQKKIIYGQRFRVIFLDIITNITIHPIHFGGNYTN